jgi:hypothetical protein
MFRTHLEVGDDDTYLIYNINILHFVQTGRNPHHDTENPFERFVSYESRKISLTVSESIPSAINRILHVCLSRPSYHDDHARGFAKRLRNQSIEKSSQVLIIIMDFNEVLQSRNHLAEFNFTFPSLF